MNKEEQCIVDGKPLSGGEIELIRTFRNHRIFHVLGTGEYDEQFVNIAYVNDDYKLTYMYNPVVIDLLDEDAQKHVANVFEQIRKEQ